VPEGGRASGPVQPGEARQVLAKSSDGVKLIVGLGNPGIEYQLTPHNLGFLAVDRLADDLGVEIKNRHCKALTARGRIGSEEVLLAKPETFMNLSGMSVRELAEKYEVRPESDLMVIYDELDLPLGKIRIRERGSSAGHNGMKSIIGALGTQEFLRIRLGIAPETKILKPFRKSQMQVVDEVLDRAAEAVNVIINEGRAAAMNRFNRRDEPEEEKD
jgi:peptidyl-tRNA hydrolase, PTH1 family